MKKMEIEVLIQLPSGKILSIRLNATTIPNACITALSLLDKRAKLNHILEAKVLGSENIKLD